MVNATSNATSSTSITKNGLIFYSVLMALTPAVTFLSSQWGYLDPVYKYTLGVPTGDKRPLYSILLTVLAVNIVVGTFVSKAFEEPKDMKKKNQ